MKISLIESYQVQDVRHYELDKNKIEADFGSTDNFQDTLFSSEWSDCLLYTSPSPRDQRGARMPSSA